MALKESNMNLFASKLIGLFAGENPQDARVHFHSSANVGGVVDGEAVACRARHPFRASVPHSNPALHSAFHLLADRAHCGKLSTNS